MQFEYLFYGVIALHVLGAVLYLTRRRKTAYPTIEEMKWLAGEAYKAVTNAQYITSSSLSNAEKLSYALGLLDNVIKAEGLVIDPALREIVVEIVYRALKPGFKAEIPDHK
jgi:hypothetical protein